MAQGIRMQSVQARYEGRLLAEIQIRRLPHRFNFMLALPQTCGGRGGAIRGG